MRTCTAQANIGVQVFDGTSVVQNFNINEAGATNWPDWTLTLESGTGDSGTDFGWSQGTVSCTSSSRTITVVVNCLPSQAPMIALIGDPEIRTSAAPGTQGGPEVSSDHVEYADGGIQPCTCVASPAPASVYSNVNQTLVKGMFGYGGRNDPSIPQLIGDGMIVQAINVPDPCNCDDCCPKPTTATFIEPDRHYMAMAGTLYTLVDTATDPDDSNGNLILSAPDGTVWQFADPETEGPYATAPWEKTILADGDTTEVTQWINASGHLSSMYARGDQMYTVEEFVSPAAPQPYAITEYRYITNSSDPNFGLCNSITYLDWNSTLGEMVYTKQVTYTYYGAGDSNGLPGDMEGIVTQYAVGTLPQGTALSSSDWSGSDTYYFRYYTAPTYNNNGIQIGFAHGLRDELLPNTFSAIAAQVDSGDTNPWDQLADVDEHEPSSYLDAQRLLLLPIQPG